MHFGYSEMLHVVSNVGEFQLCYFVGEVNSG